MSPVDAGGVPAGKSRLRATALVLLVTFGALLALEWTFLRREAVRHAEDSAREMTAFLYRELENTFPLPTILEGFEDPGMYEYFDHLIRDKLRLLGLLRARIYAPDGRVVYSTDPKFVGRAFPDHEEVAEAARGQTVSEILTESGFRRRYGLPAPVQYIETYLPLPKTGPDGRAYVFEAYQDFVPYGAPFVRSFLLSAVSTALVLALAFWFLVALTRRADRLERQVETLESFLPICAKCKKIRVEEEGKPKQWVGLEQYFEERQAVTFSHGLCEDCLRELYPDLADDVLNKRKD